jgi:GAF domain-containing protein
MLLAPILVGPELLGVIVLGHQTAGQFDLNHLNLGKGVARQTAQAILNARHQEEEESRSRLERKFVRF